MGLEKNMKLTLSPIKNPSTIKLHAENDSDAPILINTYDIDR